MKDINKILFSLQIFQFNIDSTINSGKQQKKHEQPPDLQPVVARVKINAKPGTSINNNYNRQSEQIITMKKIPQQLSSINEQLTNNSELRSGRQTHTQHKIKEISKDEVKQLEPIMIDIQNGINRIKEAIELQVLYSSTEQYDNFEQIQQTFKILEHPQYLYYGQLNNNVPQGLGYQIFKKEKVQYYGQFEKGLQKGIGCLQMQNNISLPYENKNNIIKYIGCIQNHYLNGLGKIVFNNNVIFSGQFLNNELIDNGAIRCINGDFYVGDFNKGTLSGNGFHIQGSSGLVTRVKFDNNNFVLENKIIRTAACEYLRKRNKEESESKRETIAKESLSDKIEIGQYKVISTYRGAVLRGQIKNNEQIQLQSILIETKSRGKMFTENGEVVCGQFYKNNMIIRRSEENSIQLQEMNGNIMTCKDLEQKDGKFMKIDVLGHITEILVGKGE